MNAVVTGATKGMGKAIVLKLAKAGFNIAICSRNQNEIDMFCKELMFEYPTIKAVGLRTDCSQQASVKNFENFVLQQFLTVDVLINNAGIYTPQSILDEGDEVLINQFQVNTFTAYSLCKFFGKQMRLNKAGHIINICSSASITPVNEAGSYTVTKFALLGLTKVLRQELMQHNVKVTAIIPGSTLTNSWAGTSIPENRFIAAEDIANAVMYCLSVSSGANVDEIIINPLSGNI